MTNGEMVAFAVELSDMISTLRLNADTFQKNKAARAQLIKELKERNEGKSKKDKEKEEEEKKKNDPLEIEKRAKQ